MRKIVVHHVDELTRTADVPAPWVVLTGPDAALRPERPPSTRATVAQFLAVAVVLVVAVGLIGAYVIKHVAEQQSVRDVAELTDEIGQSVVQPALTDRMATDPAETSRVLGRVLRPSLQNQLLVRVKVWTRAGTILYSDEPRLVGQRFELDDEAQEALGSPRTAADISNLKAPENRYERGQGTLLEVYRPMWTPSGTELLLETYFRYDTVRERSAGLWRGFGGILLSCVATLLVLLVPVFLLFLRRGRRAHQQRQELAQRALAASDEERRRIGASLHDGAVQQLVAASFQLAGQAEHARAAGDTERSRDFDVAAGTVRDTIGGLRSLLVEIYPPSVESAGLPTALADLTRTVADGHVEVHLDVDEDVAGRLSHTAREEMFRVVQESLRNAVKHARARVVTVRLEALPDRVARLEVVDDGAGFDAAGVVAEGVSGHLGLRLLAHAADRCGARLEIASRPGHGTIVRMEVPWE